MPLGLSNQAPGKSLKTCPGKPHFHLRRHRGSLGRRHGDLSSARGGKGRARRFSGTGDWLRGTIDAAIPRNIPGDVAGPGSS